MGQIKTVKVEADNPRGFSIIDQREFEFGDYTLWVNSKAEPKPEPIEVKIEVPEVKKEEVIDIGSTLTGLVVKPIDIGKIKVSIIIPVIRPDSAKRLIESIKLNAGISQYEIVKAEDKVRIGCPKMVKKLVKKTKYDFVCFLGDDTELQPDCIANALRAMASLPDGWGLVGLNDNFQDGHRIATHWLASKKLLPFLDGEFFHTGYYHNRCDQELTDRAKELGRYVWAIDAKLEHHHPIVKEIDIKKWDKDYKRTNDKEHFEADIILFAQRKTQRHWEPLVNF